MNTLQLKRALERDTFTKKIFGGVFAADELPKTFDTFPYGFVANTDPSTEPGTHWVAFYFPSRDKGEFFDSYGYPPEQYGFESYKIETWNKHKLQISTFGRQNKKRTSQSFRTIWLKNYSGIKFTRGKLFRCYFRPFHREIQTL